MHFPRFGLPKIARRKVAMSGGSLLSHRVDRRSQLALEPLEDRLLLSVSFSPGPYLVPVNNVDRAEGTIGTNATPIEPQVAIDPVHPSTLALSQQDGLQLSTDAGATFSRPITYPQIQTGPVVNKGDTTTVFDSHGRLFWANLSDVTGILTVYVTQLDPTTGAPIPRATHAVSTPPAASMSYDDKDFLAVDSHDNLYVAWTRFSGCSDPGAANPLDCSATTVMISRSTDQGQTWSPPVTVSDPADGFTWPATVSIATSGDVYVAYHATPATSFAALNDANGEVVVARYSNDLGTLRSKTAAFTPGNAAIRGLFSPSGVFSQTYPGTDFFTAGTGQSPVLTDPARPRNVYVISVNDPSAGGPGDPADLVFARSTDRGAHWRTSTLEDGPNGSFQLFPTASIDQFGDIVVAWYDNRAGLKDGAGNYLLDVYAKYSTDGGLTWSPAFQVNDLNNHFNTQNIPPDPQLGIPRIADYIGTSLFGGTAYVTWEGNRGAHDQQVFLDSFALRGSLTVSGDKGALDDNIVLSALPNNPGFIQVLVNGEQQYAGLLSGVAGGIQINSLAGNDQLTVDFGNGNPIPAGGLSFSGSSGVNSLRLIGGTETAESYAPGSSIGSGTIAITSDGVAGTISFDRLTSIFDNVSGQVSVEGAASNDLITYQVGADPADGFVTVNRFARTSSPKRRT